MQRYAVVPPVVTAEMLNYTHWRYALLIGSVVFNAAVQLLILQCGWSAKLRDWAESRACCWLAQLGLFLTGLTLLTSAIHFPYGFLAGFVLEQHFGLSTQSWLSWLADYCKELAVAFCGTIVSWSLVFWCIRKFTRGWPIILGASLSVMLATVIFIYPVVIDPLFNSYIRMPDGSLRSGIVRLADSVGIANVPVFVVDKSKQTNKLNAEVTGLFSSARVVVWDTTLKRMRPDEVLSVVGHELGHFVLHHILKGYLLSVCGILCGMWLAGKLLPGLTTRLPRRWGIKGMSDPAIIPAIMLTLGLLGFLAEPLVNAVSRSMEAEADQFGLAITGDRAAMARAFVALSQNNLSDPDPPAVIRFWFFSHPSLRERIDFALGITR